MISSEPTLRNNGRFEKKNLFHGCFFWNEKFPKTEFTTTASLKYGQIFSTFRKMR